MEMEKDVIGWERCRRVPQVEWRRVHKHKWHASHQVPQVGWRWGKAPYVHITHKQSGPTGWMEKSTIGTRRMEKRLSGDFYATGTRRMEKRLSANFYDELQASRMSNYRSHSYTSDEKVLCGDLWWSVVHYRSNIVRHRCVISSMTKPCSSQY